LQTISRRSKGLKIWKKKQGRRKRADEPVVAHIDQCKARKKRRRIERKRGQTVVEKQKVLQRLQIGK